MKDLSQWVADQFRWPHGSEIRAADAVLTAEFLALNHESSILEHSSNHLCGFSMMEQVRLCAVWPMENWLGSSLNKIQGWTTVRESYSRALEQGPLGFQFPLPLSHRPLSREKGRDFGMRRCGRPRPSPLICSSSLRRSPFFENEERADSFSPMILC